MEELDAFIPLEMWDEDHISTNVFAPSLSSDVYLMCSKISLNQVSHRAGMCLFEIFLP